MSWINRESLNGNSDREKDYPFARWMSWLFLVASILLLIYTYYRAEIYHQGGSNSIYFKYYLISLAGILFWGFVLRLREGIRASIVMVVTSLVVGLYMVEGGLTFLWLGQPTRTATAAELGIEYDTRTKLEVIEDLIVQGVDAVPAVRPQDVLTMDKRLLPLGGFSNKTTVGENESGRRMIYLSDRYGFNNPNSEWDAKEVEWLLTGDSFTEGVAVEPRQNIAGQLRVITQESAINLGRSGNGPILELAELIEYAGAVKPRIVLWMYFEGNDLLIADSWVTNFQRNKSHPLLMQYMEDGFSQNLINRQKEIDNMLAKYIVSAKAEAEAKEKEKAEAKAEAKAQELLYKTRWIRLSTIRSIIDATKNSQLIHADTYVNVVDPLFAKILTKAKAEVEAWEGELYFVYLPIYERYKNKAISHDKLRKKAEVIDLVKQLDIPVIDIHQEVFADHADPLALFPFRQDGHYNADGYSEVAKAIVTGVKKYEQSNK